MARRIRQARREAGYSQAELAALMGITRSACSQWEIEGGTRPRGQRLERLAMILGVSVEWLATGEGSTGGPQRAADTAPFYRNGLASDELELLERYARLQCEGRAALLVLLDGLGKRKG